MLAPVGATICLSPTDEWVADGVLLIEGQKIAAVGGRDIVAVPENAKVLDCSGNTITAGFWNSHVHFFERKWAGAATIPRDELNAQLRDMSARFGFTTVFDIGSMWETRGLCATGSNQAKLVGRASTRRAKACFHQVPFPARRFSTRWVS